MVAVLESDRALCAEILKLVNSAFVGLASQVEAVAAQPTRPAGAATLMAHVVGFACQRALVGHMEADAAADTWQDEARSQRLERRL